MRIELGDRTPETVAVYYTQAQRPEIKAVLPQKAQSLEEALEDYRRTLLPGAESCGRTILADGRYIGDIWCYCISADETPNAMLSFCVFDDAYRNRGAATEAAALFMQEVRGKYGVKTIGAFTYEDNAASRKVLEKSGFALMEEFTEEGRRSCYYQYEF